MYQLAAWVETSAAPNGPPAAQEMHDKVPGRRMLFIDPVVSRPLLRYLLLY
jgi:hypothetical protein